MGVMCASIMGRVITTCTDGPRRPLPLSPRRRSPGTGQRTRGWATWPAEYRGRGRRGPQGRGHAGGSGGRAHARRTCGGLAPCVRGRGPCTVETKDFPKEPPTCVPSVRGRGPRTGRTQSSPRGTPMSVSGVRGCGPCTAWTWNYPRRLPICVFDVRGR